MFGQGFDSPQLHKWSLLNPQHRCGIFVWSRSASLLAADAKKNEAGQRPAEGSIRNIWASPLGIAGVAHAGAQAIPAPSPLVKPLIFSGFFVDT